MSLVGRLAEQVIAIGANGDISNRASVSDALRADPLLRADVLNSNPGVDEKEGTAVCNDDAAKEADEPSGRLVVKEEILEGRIGWNACAFCMFCAEWI